MGQSKCTLLLENKVSIWNFSTFNWGKMHANEMQEHDSSQEKEAASSLNFCYHRKCNKKVGKVGGIADVSSSC